MSSKIRLNVDAFDSATKEKGWNDAELAEKMGP